MPSPASPPPASGAAAGGITARVWPLHRQDLSRLLGLLLLGLLVGLACWPLNRADAWQDVLLRRLPGFAGGSWRLDSLLIAAAPLLVVPLLVVLQQGRLAAGAGSGIPQTIASLKDPGRAPRLLAAAPTVARLGLWTAATLALVPMGREGPVVHVGAAVAHALRRRTPRLVASLQAVPLLAVGAGAGLAGGFNSPLMGVLFVVEELTRSFQTSLIWPTLLSCSAAALVGNLTGLALYPLGMVPNLIPEWQQVLWALPIGVGGGVLGGLFARGLLEVTQRLQPRLRRRPLLWGLGLGAALAAMALLSGGRSGGDGEALMDLLLQGRGGLPVPGAPLGALEWLLILASRIVAPILTLASGIPGGLIDPAFTLGAVFGAGTLHLLGGDSQLGVALGMAAGLAGATQLPLMTIVFALRMAGDQQWLFGLALSAVVAAYVGRHLQPDPIYHALTELGARQPETGRSPADRPGP